jgi:hypothetical protein
MIGAGASRRAWAMRRMISWWRSRSWPGQRSKANSRSSDGGVRVAINAASTANVPAPHIGSMIGCDPS